MFAMDSLSVYEDNLKEGWTVFSSRSFDDEKLRDLSAIWGIRVQWI
jgi:hypothetical protein